MLAPREDFRRLTDLNFDAVSCKLGDILRVPGEAAETLERLSLLNVDVTRETHHNASHLPSPAFTKLKHLMLRGIFDFQSEAYDLYLRLCLATASLETLSVRDSTFISHLYEGRLLLPTLGCVDIPKI